MTVINIVVESNLTGCLAGYHSLTIDDSRPVQEIVDSYCEAKGVTVELNFALVNKHNLILVNGQPISDFAVTEGEILQLTRLRKRSKCDFRQWWTMSGIGMLVAIIGLVACVLLYAVFRNIPDNYAMVIDAGSTHTDMILYSWPGSKRNNTGEVTQVQLCSAPGGIAHVAPVNISSYFKGCFDETLSSIKPDSKFNREVLFGGTAGMRLQNQTDPDGSAQVISRVRNYIHQSGWTYKEPNVGIISGSTEGLSGWITLNFLNHTLLEKGTVYDTIGAMDLGGASTQISIEVNESLRDAPNVYPTTLFGNKFYVFSVSYLCHGVMEALRRYHGLLKVEQGGSNNISSPCEPLGYNTTLTQSYFDSPCTEFIKTDEKNNSEPLVITGTANANECKRVVSKLLNFTECTNENMGLCMDPSILPPDILIRDYYGFAAFSYITQDLGLTSVVKKHQMEHFLENFCKYSVIELKFIKEKSTNHKRKFEQLCFEGQYMYTLLTEVYGFTHDLDWVRITFANQLKGSTLGWSLGYMVNATEEIAAGPPVPTLKVVPFSLLTVLCILFVLLSIGFIFHGFKVRKNTPNYHRKRILKMDHELEKFIQPSNTVQSI